MTGSIIYLDIDDEITSAAARIREVEGSRVAAVLPYGSRVATSRINFRLLSRDALTHEKQLSVVSGDSATRALAASAGLPVFSSVGEYESSLLLPERGDRGGDVDHADADSRSPGPAVSATGLGAAAPRAATVRTTLPRTPESRAPESPVPGPPIVRPSGRGTSRTPLLVGLAILALAVVVAGVGAYLLLPSATIAVTPKTERLGPLSLTVVADPTASVPDATTFVVPAVKVPLEVNANGTFPATGKRTEVTKATGIVRFENLDFLSPNTVPAGSIVSTQGGIRFQTLATIRLARADLVGLTIIPSTATVRVTAVDGGKESNVEPNTIRIIPRGEDPITLKVNNPDVTTGGTSTDFPRITQKDVDAAVASLKKTLAAAFKAKVQDPALASGGATVFTGTAKAGEATPTVEPATLVGQEIVSFDLGLSATGSVITVDAAPVGQIAEVKLQASVKPGYKLIADSVEIRRGDPIVTDQTVSFPVTVTAQQIAVLDPELLRSLVLGKSVEEARAILARYGTTQIEVWPDWVRTIPTYAARVDVTVGQAVPIGGPGSSAKPSSRPSARPSSRPSADASPSGSAP